MRLLEIQRDEKKSRLKVECAGRLVSVSSYCAFCTHCHGVTIKGKHHPPPQEAVLNRMGSGGSVDDTLMNAVMQFNSLTSDAEAVECNDTENEGFHSRFRS